MMDSNEDELIKKFIIDSVRLIKKTSDTFTKSQTASGGLTPPQINVMIELVKEDGLSLKELSKRLNLSHSTVSGIVDRLESREIVLRRQDSADGRFIRIFKSERVNDYCNKNIVQMYAPFINAIQNALPEERSKILEGLSIFCKLLKEPK